MRWLSNGLTWLFSRRIDEELAQIGRWVLVYPERLILAAGVVLRLATYFHDRVFWLDEISLWGNIVDKPILDFSQPLAGGQLAPIGFLAAQRALVRLLGTSRLVGRLIPIVSGIVALVYFAYLARRVLPRPGALVALVLFALSDDLIYYSSEMKPYTVDLALGLAVTFAAAKALESSPSLRCWVAIGLAALLAPWCAFASAFVVAGCGATLVLNCLLTRRYRDAVKWIALGIGWGVSFAAAYVASRALLGPSTTMFAFWRFAFLPVVPLSPANLAQGAGILLETFVNPLNLVSPNWPGVCVILPFLLMLLGAISLARRSWPIWSILALPVLLAMAASAIHRYPFHGRLILELVPALLLFVAEGTERIRVIGGRCGRLLYGGILILLLAYPCMAPFYRLAFGDPRTYNSHGDLHDNLFIDYRISSDSPKLGFFRGSEAARTGASGSHHDGQRLQLSAPLEYWNFDAPAAVGRRLMGAQPDHRPVGRGHIVGQGGPFALDGAQERMNQVGMRAAVAAALQERQVLGVLDGRGLGESADRFGQ
jgi:hypothetical protein